MSETAANVGRMSGEDDVGRRMDLDEAIAIVECVIRQNIANIRRQINEFGDLKFEAGQLDQLRRGGA